MVNGVIDTASYTPSRPLRLQKPTNDAVSVPAPSGSSVVASDPNEDIVAEVVKEFVESDELFTAYDITKTARQRGAIGKHNDLKKLVHDIYLDDEMPSYSREVVEIPLNDGSTVRPFLYLPNGSDVEDYLDKIS